LPETFGGSSIFVFCTFIAFLWASFSNLLPPVCIYVSKHVCTERSVWWKCQTHFSSQIFCISSLLDDSKFFVRFDVSRSHHSDHPHQHFHPLHRSRQSLQNQSEVSEWGSGGRISGVRKFFLSGYQNYCQFSGDRNYFSGDQKRPFKALSIDFWSPEKRPFRSPEIRFLDHFPGKLELYLKFVFRIL